MSIASISTPIVPLTSSAEPTETSVQSHFIIDNAFTFLDKLDLSINGEIKTNISTLLNEIYRNGVVERPNQLDKTARPAFVLSQAFYEYEFISRLEQDVDSVICIVHTDTPTTALCVEDSKSTESDLNPLIEPKARGNIDIELSIKARAPVVHKLCKTCTIDRPYYVTYNRTREDAAVMKTYKTVDEKDTEIAKAKKSDEVFEKNKNNPAYHVQIHRKHDVKPELSGASYLYKEGSTWRYFGISALQAKDAQDNKDWKIWDVATDSEQGKALVEKYRKVWPSYVYDRIKPE